MNIPKKVWIPALLAIVIGILSLQWYIRIRNRIPWMPENPVDVQVYIWGPKGDRRIDIPKDKIDGAIQSLKNGFFGLHRDQSRLFWWQEDEAIALAPIGYMKLDGIRYNWFGYDSYLNEVSRFVQ